MNRASFCLLIALFAIPTRATAQPLTLESILEDWRTRSASIKSIKCKAVGTELIPMGRYDAKAKTKPTPSADARFPRNTTWMINFPEHWIRRERESETYLIAENKAVPFFAADYFDGAVIKSLTPRKKNSGRGYSPAKYQPDAWIKSDGFKQFFLLSQDLPLFLSIGIVPPPPRLPSPDKLQFSYDSARFTVLATSIEIPETGVKCFLLRYSGKEAVDDLWVDIETRGLVRRWQRHERFDNKSYLWAQIDIEYDGLRPQKWEITDFADDKGSVGKVVTQQVTQFEINPSYAIADFQFDYVPGQIVMDDKFGHVYEVDRRGGLQEISAKKQRLQPNNAGTDYRVWILAVVIPVVLIGLFVLMKKRAPSRAS